MKKLFFAFAFLTGLISQGQVFQKYNQYGGEWKGHAVRRVSMFPTGCGDPAALNSTDAEMKLAASYFDSCNHRYWLYDPKLATWDSVHAGVVTTDVPTWQETLDEDRNGDSAYIFNGASAERYVIRHRNGLSLNFPVVVIKPVTDNKNLAVDFMPRGTPGNFSDNGIAWLDVCDSDVSDNAFAPTAVARVGINSAAVQFGSRSFGGAAIKPVEFIVDLDKRITLNTNNTATFNIKQITQSQAIGGDYVGYSLFNTNNAAAGSDAILFLGNDFGALRFGFLRWNNAAAAASGSLRPNSLQIATNDGATGGLIFGSYGTTGKFSWHTGSGAGITEKMRLDSVGSLGLGTSAINGAAILELVSTVKGFLPPRMTAAQRLAITPVAGLIVYDTDSARVFVYNTAWHGLKHTDEGGGGSGTPAGNFGNVQINRWGAFDTPGSDSLDFDGGLKVKGVLNVDGSGTNFFDVTANAISALMNGSGFDHNFTFGSGNVILSRVPDVSGVSSSLNLSTSATLNSQNTTGPESFIQVSPDSITLDSDVGRFQIPTVETSTDTTLNKPMVWNLSTKRLTRLDRWPVGSGGGWGTTGTVATLTGNATLAQGGNSFSFSGGAVTINDGQENYGLNIKGDGDANLVNTYPAFDRFGIGIPATSIAYKFQVKQSTDKNIGIGSQGSEVSIEATNDAVNAGIPIGIYGSTVSISGAGVQALLAGSSEVVFNEPGANLSSRFESDALTEAWRIDGSSGELRGGSLAGTGSRTVLADAEGDLSAPVSDRSVKENIRRLQPGINAIMKLKPVSFEYKTGYKNYGAGVQMGFIAQDIQKIFPNSVYRNNSNGKLGYNATDLIPVLVKAVQDQQKQIDELKELVKILMQKK